MLVVGSVFVKNWLRELSCETEVGVGERFDVCETIKMARDLYQELAWELEEWWGCKKESSLAPVTYIGE